MEYWRDGKANPPLQKSIRSLKEIGVMKMNTKQITLTSLFIALCVIVPFLFHLVGLGAIFLPMFLPILLAGFLIEFRFALLVGLLGPLTSSLATGMPPFFPTAISMIAEGMVAASVASFLFHTQKKTFWLALPVAIMAERITRVIMILLIFPIFGLPAKQWSIIEITATLPGIVLQLFLIPLVLFMLWKSKIIERKLWWKIS